MVYSILNHEGFLHLLTEFQSSSSRIRADVVRKWGWQPTKTDEDFLNTFEAEADVILDTLDKNPESSSNYVKQVPKK